MSLLPTRWQRHVPRYNACRIPGLATAGLEELPRQIGEFRKYVPGGNNRPVQPLNGRVVEYYSQP
jgi:hypothetical protein